MLAADDATALSVVGLYKLDAACLALLENGKGFFLFPWLRGGDHGFLTGCSERASIISHIMHASSGKNLFYLDLSWSVRPFWSTLAALLPTFSALTPSGDSQCGGRVCGGMREGYWSLVETDKDERKERGVVHFGLIGSYVDVVGALVVWEGSLETSRGVWLL